MIYLVGRLLEVTNFPDDVSNLLNVTHKKKQHESSMNLPIRLHKSRVLINLITILILEKLSNPSGVKSGVPSSMKLKSVRYMPR